MIAACWYQQVPHRLVAISSELLKVKLQPPPVPVLGREVTAMCNSRGVSSDVLALRAWGIIMSSFCLIQGMSR